MLRTIKPHIPNNSGYFFSSPGTWTRTGSKDSTWGPSPAWVTLLPCCWTAIVSRHSIRGSYRIWAAWITCECLRPWALNPVMVMTDTSWNKWHILWCTAKNIYQSPFILLSRFKTIYPFFIFPFLATSRGSICAVPPVRWGSVIRTATASAANSTSWTTRFCVAGKSLLGLSPWLPFNQAKSPFGSRFAMRLVRETCIH